jgi:hypothetical protein
MRHVQTKFHFLRELKLQGIIEIKWIGTDYNTADIFTKNLSGPVTERHARLVVGTDECYAEVKNQVESAQLRGSQGESVRVENSVHKDRPYNRHADVAGFTAEKKCNGYSDHEKTQKLLNKEAETNGSYKHEKEKNKKGKRIHWRLVDSPRNLQWSIDFDPTRPN